LTILSSENLCLASSIQPKLFRYPCLTPSNLHTLLARQAATIDVLSGGRLTLGIGIGVRENDYLASGFDFHRRGRLVEEQLPILRRLWSGADLSNEVGAIGPRPCGANGLELLIGGYGSSFFQPRPISPAAPSAREP
jgi:alkanesulfonate monooxygenase SsuD/methylene tetrahydromethanopterin reductase-like flavin-dependent oxidoreductase (luciferase family)